MDHLQTLDCVVVGGGPAGATAAIYLGRFHRSCLVIDAGESRAAWIVRTRNHPGFPYGVGGKTLLRRMHHQAERYGARFAPGSVEAVSAELGGFRVDLAGRSIWARTVVLACGTVDKPAQVPGFESALRRGLLRICPICDGYEASGQAIAVIGDGPHGAREASFLTAYSDRVTLLHTEAPALLSREARGEAAAAGVEVMDASLDQIAFDLAGGAVRCGDRLFDLAYSALGCAPRTGLARGAGAAVDGEGRLIVDAHQQTSVPGLYAAGDLVRGLNQISTAQGEGATAATHIHNVLRQG